MGQLNYEKYDLFRLQRNLKQYAIGCGSYLTDLEWNRLCHVYYNQ